MVSWHRSQGSVKAHKPSPARGEEKAPATGQPGQLCPGHRAQPATVPGTPGRVQCHMSEVWGPATLSHSCSQPQTKLVSCLKQQDVCGLSQGPGSAPGMAQHCHPQPPFPLLPTERGWQRTRLQPSAPAPGQDAPGLGCLPLCTGPPISAASSPVLVVDVVSKARGVDDRQLHANPLLFNL